MLDSQQLGEARPREEVNWPPWSEVMMVGTPNRATHAEMRTSTQSSAAMDFKGPASSHLDDLYTIVYKYLNPSADAGRGPTRSTFTWVKRRSGTGIGWTGAVCCGLALPSAQSWQSRHHTATSEAMPRQTTRLPSAAVWHVCRSGLARESPLRRLGVRYRDERSRLSGRGVTDDLLSLDVNVLQLQ